MVKILILIFPNFVPQVLGLKLWGANLLDPSRCANCSLLPEEKCLPDKASGWKTLMLTILSVKSAISL